MKKYADAYLRVVPAGKTIDTWLFDPGVKLNGISTEYYEQYYT